MAQQGVKRMVDPARPKPPRLEHKNGAWRFTVSEDEWDYAMEVAVRQFSLNVKSGHRDGMDFLDLNGNLWSRMAEYAFSLAIGCTWLGQKDWHGNKADVAPNWQVRTHILKPWKNNVLGSLLVKAKDDDDWNAVLTSTSGDSTRGMTILIWGWMPVKEARSRVKSRSAAIIPQDLYGFESMEDPFGEHATILVGTEGVR